MLRRVNAAVFEAPVGARVEVVAESQSNNGVTDARFEYAGTVLPRDVILGLPGCSFTVESFSARLQAVVAFDDNAPGTARYDLFEVENGVLTSLGKFTLKSDGTPLIDFVIDPVEAAVPAGASMRSAPRAAPRVAGGRAAKKARAPKTVKKKTARKKSAKKKTATKKTARKKSARKKSARSRGGARKRR